MKSLNEVRTVSDPLLREYVVMPSGQIKTVYYERNVSSPLIRVEFARAENGRVVGVAAVSISAKMPGWSLLRDLYEAEGRLVDYETFLLYQEQTRKRGLTAAIGDAYLPDEVLRRRAVWHEEQSRLDLPAPQRAQAQSELPAKKGSKNAQ